jgi:hypothetical protein
LIDVGPKGGLHLFGNASVNDLPGALPKLAHNISDQRITRVVEISSFLWVELLVAKAGERDERACQSAVSRPGGEGRRTNCLNVSIER